MAQSSGQVLSRQASSVAAAPLTSSPPSDSAPLLFALLAHSGGLVEPNVRIANALTARASPTPVTKPVPNSAEGAVVVRQTMLRKDHLAVNGRPQANGLPLPLTIDNPAAQLALQGRVDAALVELFSDCPSSESMDAWIKESHVWSRFGGTICAAAIADCVDLVTEIAKQVGSTTFVDLCLTPLDLPPPPLLVHAPTRNRYYNCTSRAVTSGVTPAHFIASSQNAAVFKRLVRECIEADKHPPHLLSAEFEGPNLPIVPFVRKVFALRLRDNEGRSHIGCSLSIVRLVTAAIRETGAHTIRCLISCGQAVQLRWILDAIGALDVPVAWRESVWSAVRDEMLFLAAESNAVAALEEIYSFGNPPADKLSTAFTNAINANAIAAMRRLHAWGATPRLAGLVDRAGPQMTEALRELGITLEDRLCVVPAALLAHARAAMAPTPATATPTTQTGPILNAPLPVM